jgi:hypothetical protein
MERKRICVNHTHPTKLMMCQAGISLSEKQNERKVRRRIFQKFCDSNTFNVEIKIR